MFGISTLLQPDVSFEDLRVFPPHVFCGRMLAANENARKLIGARETIDLARADRWWEARCEANRAQQAWEALGRASDIDFDESYRLSNLRSLRGMLGWKDYYAGQMPCAVPLWAFPRADDPVAPSVGSERFIRLLPR